MARRSELIDYLIGTIPEEDQTFDPYAVRPWVVAGFTMDGGLIMAESPTRQGTPPRPLPSA